MQRRTFVTLAVSAALLSFTSGFAYAQEVVKIGASAPKTGPLAGGAAVTHWPNVKMWVDEVNARGGLKIGDTQQKIELVEYDDQTNPENAIQNIQRLATVDKVDFIVTPYSTGINVATAPMIAQHGYPHITTSAATDGVEEFAKRWNNSFWMLGTATQLAKGAVETLVKLRDKGDIGNKVALVNVTDAFGMELLGAAKPALTDAGFELVYEASFPLGTQDLAPVISSAKAASPDAFVAFSYPGETFALTEQAQIQGLDVGAFYVGVGTAFPSFAARFGKAAEGIIGIGGVNTDDPKVKDYMERHQASAGQGPDFWASATTYAGLQVLEQAIEQAGTKDRAAVVQAIKDGTFDTVIGQVKFQNNVNPNVWTVGQWRDGAFVAVAADGIEISQEPVKKQGWE
ncbi:twin-arginine translocation pathway signal protein [Nitratireductor aestuarii]|uniref:Twin-arginine translocation pathway signal protein n=1 Tax=Nitratireductor aestuarii TaxID=1735103 RepID=A0A916VZD6_9HYPH|nr:amino acid ABC transporter substrate-binding protein [Nitratireductor aestuarii]GGA54714.1 twin-arginine translocation pathway signal protein [Nitratireductor aestuarii]